MALSNEVNTFGPETRFLLHGVLCATKGKRSMRDAKKKRGPGCEISEGVNWHCNYPRQYIHGMQTLFCPASTRSTWVEGGMDGRRKREREVLFT
jgi:hypothetical protein